MFMEKKQKAYIIINGQLVEEWCSDSPLTCSRHRAWHQAKIKMRFVNDESVKDFFDTTSLPEKEATHKKDFQPPKSRRVGIIFNGDTYKKHKELAQELADKLTPQEKESLMFYTNTGHQDIINHIYGKPRRIISTTSFPDGTEKHNLAGGNELSDDEWSETLQNHINNVNSVIIKAGEQDEPEVLYRAITVHEANGLFKNQDMSDEDFKEKFLSQNFSEGSEFYRKNITSVSSDPAAVLSFFLKKEAKSNGSAVIVEYKTKKGARLSKEAQTTRMIHDEYEVLLPAYQKFRVVAVYKDIKYTVDARKRFQDRGMSTDGFGKIVAPKVTLVQVEEID
jgi:hypothetical protein